jgi:hypothetical protein
MSCGLRTAHRTRAASRRPTVFGGLATSSGTGGSFSTGNPCRTAALPHAARCPRRLPTAAAVAIACIRRASSDVSPPSATVGMIVMEPYPHDVHAPRRRSRRIVASETPQQRACSRAMTKP